MEVTGHGSGGTAVAGVTRGRRLPADQPWRAVVVLLGYLVTVVVAVIALRAALGLLGVVFSLFFAVAGTLPVALLAPRRKPAAQPATEGEADAIPVLRRPLRDPVGARPR